MGTVRDIMNILQEGYSMASASSLDRVVATRIVDYFTRAGWLSADEVAHIVKAAGGKVVVSRQQLESANLVLVQYRNELEDTIILEARDNVESGQVNVRPTSGH